jgi:hypothetical protein
VRRAPTPHTNPALNSLFVGRVLSSGATNLASVQCQFAFAIDRVFARVAFASGRSWLCLSPALTQQVADIGLAITEGDQRREVIKIDPCAARSLTIPPQAELAGTGQIGRYDAAA